MNVGCKVTREVDLWAVGVTAFELLFTLGRHPFCPPDCTKEHIFGIRPYRPHGSPSATRLGWMNAQLRNESLLNVSGQGCLAPQIAFISRKIAPTKSSTLPGHQPPRLPISSMSCCAVREGGRSS